MLSNEEFSCHETIKSLIENKNSENLCSEGCQGLCYNRNYERIQRKRCCGKGFCGCCDLKVHVSKYSLLNEVVNVQNNLIDNINDENRNEFYVKTLTKDIIGNSDEEIDILNSVFTN